MQDTHQKASILIWSIFLSLIISIIFINTSSKIGKTIRNNSLISESITSHYQVQKILNEKNYINTQLDNGENIIFEDNNKYTGVLKVKETSETQFPSINNTIDISILDGGPIFYSFSNNSASGVVNKSISIIVSQTGSLYLRNLGGHLKYNISSDTDFLTKRKGYKVTKKIGHKEVIKSSTTIKNF
ncbi:hypothetical protein A9Q91_01935 [Candidatus Gracilibacteria bacterium 28_42_T64]|nr:hypothetical protein A9Q91_01935 [Candidatus Gracilibacteria bacterium 28_42_T64]